MFVDQVNISLKAGKGGDGMVAFRREKFVPNGGPAGGDGGRGANIIFQVDTGMSTLMDFKYKKIFKADNGINGGIKRMTGAGASDLIIEVPEGTTIINDDTDQPIADLTNKNSEFVVAKGGRGGRGNIHFASAKNPAPEIAEKGEPGEEINIRLELRLLADVGLVGFPSVGKSTLLKAITNSKPKVAEYHFTTLIPNLGIVKTDYNNDFVIADLPGLIEGASNGVGLGIQFLRHVERTRVILHLIDMSDTEGRDQYDDYQKINEELKNYDEEILKRPQIIVASKMDMPGSEDNLELFKQQLKENNDKLAEKIIPISSVTHSGLKELVQETSNLLENTPKFPIMENEIDQDVIYEDNDEKPFEITRDMDGDWLLTGNKIEKLFKMTDTDHEQSMLRFSRQLKGMGVDQALREAGAKDGDLVTILDFSFNYVE